MAESAETEPPRAGPPYPEPEQPLFERLLALSREAHDRGQHEVAYHALTAAMHAASDAADPLALAAIGREAEAQITWIDRHAPTHRISTASARLHHHPGVYAMLVRQVTVHEHMATQHISPPPLPARD